MELNIEYYWHVYWKLYACPMPPASIVAYIFDKAIKFDGRL